MFHVSVSGCSMCHFHTGARGAFVTELLLGWFWLAPASFLSFHSSLANYFSPASRTDCIALQKK
jgi:hypothetical protein